MSQAVWGLIFELHNTSMTPHLSFHDALILKQTNQIFKLK